MNILILGCGEIGSALAKQLVQQGHCVTTVSRSEQSFAQIRHLKQDIHHLSLDKQILYDWVYVILSPDARSVSAYQSTFIDTARPIFNTLIEHPVQHIVLVSSTRVYGENTGKWIDDETIPHSNDPIAQCLIAAEQLWSAYWQDRLIIIRPSGLYRQSSPYLTRLAHETKDIVAQHWTNRIHRQDVIGFLSYLLGIKNLQSSYLLSDQKPTLQYEMINNLRTRDGLDILPIASDLPETGKRIQAKHLQQSGYQLQHLCTLL